MCTAARVNLHGIGRVTEYSELSGSMHAWSPFHSNGRHGTPCSHTWYDPQGSDTYDLSGGLVMFLSWDNFFHSLIQ